MKDKEIFNLISSKRCNNLCIICGRSKEDIQETSLREIKEILTFLKSKDYDEIIFSRGEPTIRKDFLDIIKFSRELGIGQFHVQTNGRKFSDLDFAEKTANEGTGMVNIFLSVHGHKSLVHDTITGIKGSFEETIGGIDNLIALGLSPTTNTVITKNNYRYLDVIADFLIKRGVRTVQFSSIRPRGEALINHLKVVPKIETIIPYLRQALRHNSPKIKVFCEVIPFCLLGEDYIYATEMILSKNHSLEKFKSKECNKCRFRDKCHGVWESYYLLRGFNFKPVK